MRFALPGDACILYENNFFKLGIFVDKKFWLHKFLSNNTVKQSLEIKSFCLLCNFFIQFFRCATEFLPLQII